MKDKLKKFGYKVGLIALGAIIGISYMISYQTFNDLKDFIQ